MKIIMACGGTGGHIFPAFSVAEEIRRREPAAEIIYVCGKRDIENAIFKIVAGEKIISMESAAYRGFRSLLSPIFLIRLFKGLWRSFRLVIAEKPDLVVGFGGYYSFPVTFIGHWLGARTLIHEQNVVPGKANRVLAKFTDGVALSFQETRKYLKDKSRWRVTGNPIRSAIERDCRKESLDYFEFSPEKRTLLVLGGSQGAESINILFLGALKHLPDHVKKSTQVLHLCGKMSVTTSEEALKNTGISGRAYSFFERMDLAYGAANVALGRAGATFLAEIHAKRIPAVLIPYPAADGHQLVNAQWFCREHEALIAEQKDLTSEKLAEILSEFLNRTEPRKIEDARPLMVMADENSRVLLADFIWEIILSK